MEAHQVCESVLELARVSVRPQRVWTVLYLCSLANKLIRLKGSKRLHSETCETRTALGIRKKSYKSNSRKNSLVVLQKTTCNQRSAAAKTQGKLSPVVRTLLHFDTRVGFLTPPNRFLSWTQLEGSVQTTRCIVRGKDRASVRRPTNYVWKWARN